MHINLKVEKYVNVKEGKQSYQHTHKTHDTTHAHDIAPCTYGKLTHTHSHTNKHKHTHTHTHTHTHKSQ